MGMFDYIRCDYRLPDGFDIKKSGKKDYEDNFFQTKSFPCPVMDLYIIRRDGKLFHEKRSFKEVPEKKRPYYGTPEWKTRPLVRSFGMLKVAKRELVFMKDFDGIVRFYAQDNRNEWKEYKAYFRKGVVQKIKVIRDYWPNLFGVSFPFGREDEDEEYNNGIY